MPGRCAATRATAPGRASSTAAAWRSRCSAPATPNAPPTRTSSRRSPRPAGLRRSGPRMRPEGESGGSCRYAGAYGGSVMKLRSVFLLACLGLPLPALADDAVPPPSNDVFSYDTLTVDHLHEHSDFFGDSSQGNGLALSYDFSGVYLFGQWNKLDFDTLPG